MDITVSLTAEQAAGLQAECTAFNAAQGGTSKPVDLAAFTQAVIASRGDAAARQYGTIPVFAFIRRFTEKEYADTVTLASTDKLVAGLLKQLDEAEEGKVRLWKDSVKQGLAYLEGKTLAAGRAAEIARIA